jgi:hypothetical protein
MLVTWSQHADLEAQTKFSSCHPVLQIELFWKWWEILLGSPYNEFALINDKSWHKRAAFQIGQTWLILLYLIYIFKNSLKYLMI